VERAVSLSDICVGAARWRVVASLVVGHTEVIQTRLHGLVMGSLSAVSEAPISRQVVELRCSGGALQIQRLEGGRPSREPMGFVDG
jgi:hypothetical protein